MYMYMYIVMYKVLFSKVLEADFDELASQNNVSWTLHLMQEEGSVQDKCSSQ